ncbi:HNH endonuclease [Paenibacillus ferrarius]|uniref:HNH endonuclease n=1 Tax=Paenibacillus ferrarius TaxID=1469647 RepID=UPI003D2730B7
MAFQHNLKPGSTINNNELTSIFLCSPQGGMRRSLRTNTLAIISDHTKSIYEDRWIGKVFHYTGMGLNGDQDIKYSQNRTLAESEKNGVELHLFEVFRESEYMYMGEVVLSAEPYEEQQLDADDKMRKVVVFPLSLKNSKKPIAVSEKLISEKNAAREKVVEKLTNEQVLKRALSASKKAASRNTVSKTFDRDPNVMEYAKRWANGICQLCEQPAPYYNRKNKPHLHTHHIKWLSKGGEDTIENTIALCPNCHDKMHILDLQEDVFKLKQKVKNHNFGLLLEV